MCREKRYLFCRTTVCPVKNNAVVFLPLQPYDLTVLHSWFLQPHVAYWWPEPQDWSAFNIKWTTRLETNLSAYHTPWFGHIACIDDTPIGYIQHFFLIPHQLHGYPLSLAQTVGLDFFIGEPAYLGKKLSTPILDNYFSFITKMHPPVSTILIEPHSMNLRAIHVYTKAGFKVIGEKISAQNPITVLYKHL
jgi:RimJ/RimL family protein N-acetyltransferase